MIICIPVLRDEGLNSPVSEHFGSAPMFALVDPKTQAVKTIPNKNLHHEHGKCSPLASLEGHPIDAVVVGGIGAGAMSKLLAGGMKVYLAKCPTVAGVVIEFQAGSLKEATPHSACAGHHGPSVHVHTNETGHGCKK